MPAISIVTPTYNRAHLLPRVWRSLCGQTEQDFEWVVVDDGSSDNTSEVIADLDDRRIIYVWQNNSGVNGARNRGDQEVQAEYVIYLDSDDELYGRATLADMLSEIRAARPEIAWVAFTVVDAEGIACSFMPAVERLEAGYLDHVCEQKIRGEFFPVYRSNVNNLAVWPAYNGLEALRHWRIIKNHPALIINRPARIYHRRGGDDLSNAYSVIERAPQMALATNELIKEHESAWREHCPCQL